MAQDTQSQTLPELLSAAELAEYLDRPVSTIWYWRGKGLGPPAIRIGKHIRFRVDDVVQWLEAKKREAGGPASTSRDGNANSRC